MPWADIVPTESDHEEFLWLMLTYAAAMTPPGPRAIPIARADAYLRLHVEGWGRKGDLGVMAIRNTHAIGAAWVRLAANSADHAKLGSKSVPELAIAVLPEHRGKGVGTALLRDILQRCRGTFPAVTLSVREDNPAVGLYQRMGFRVQGTHENRVGGQSLIMRIDF